VVNYHRLTGDNEAAERAVNELMYFDVAPAFISIEILNRCDAESRERFKGIQKMFRSSNTAPSIARYVVRSLEVLPTETLQFFLPQFVQLLRRDIFGVFSEFIESIAKKSALICHNLIWLLQTESVSEIGHTKTVSAPYPRHGYCRQIIGSDPLPFKSSELLVTIKSSLSLDDLNYLSIECSFFDSVTNISARLKTVKDKDTHNQIIKEELLKLGLPPGLYMPTAPNRRVVGIDIESGIPMQSAAKCPFLLVFYTEYWKGPDNDNVRHPGSPNKVSDFSSQTNDSRYSEGNCDPVISSKLLDHNGSKHHIDRGLARWKLETLEIGQNRPVSPLHSQDACIFKVYDDCRQDALVMQVHI